MMTRREKSSRSSRRNRQTYRAVAGTDAVVRPMADQARGSAPDNATQVPSRWRRRWERRTPSRAAHIVGRAAGSLQKRSRSASFDACLLLFRWEPARIATAGKAHARAVAFPHDQFAAIGSAESLGWT